MSRFASKKIRSFLKKMGMVCLLIGMAPLAVSAVQIDRIAAVVDREVITESELERERRTQAKETAPLLSPLGGGNRFLEQIIAVRMVRQLAEKRGIFLSDVEFEQALLEIEQRHRFPDRAAFRQAVEAASLSWEHYLAALREEILRTKLIYREVEPDLFVTPQQAKVYYEDHPELFREEDQIAFRQIFWRVTPESSSEAIEEVRRVAEGVERAVREGASFDELAERYNEGTLAERGASLGFFARGDLLPPVESVVFNLEAGEVSPVVQTSAGFHIFQIIQKKRGVLLPFEEVYPKRLSLFLELQRDRLIQQWFHRAFKGTFIEIK